MADKYLLKDGFARDKNAALAFFPEDTLFTDPLPMAPADDPLVHRPWGIAHHNKGQSAYVPLIIDSRERPMQEWLQKATEGTEVGDSISVMELVAGFVFLEHVTWDLECNDIDTADRIQFSIEIVDATDLANGTETVDHVALADATTDDVGDGAFVLPRPEYLARNTPKYIRVRFELDKTDADGKLTWMDHCETFPCFRLRVHAGVRDSSLRPELFGHQGCCNPQTPPDLCG